MNDNIKQLMLEAGYAAPELAGRAKILASLIVKECANIAYAGDSEYLDDYDRGWQSGRNLTRDLIEEHFKE